MIKFVLLLAAALYTVYFVKRPYDIIKYEKTEKTDKILFSAEVFTAALLLVLLLIFEEKKIFVIAETALLASLLTSCVICVLIRIAHKTKAENDVISFARREEEIRKFRHDLKNSLYGAKILVDEGETHKASEYLGSMLGDADNLAKEKGCSDNLIVNAVMKKLEKRCEGEIKFSADIAVGDFLSGLSERDVAVLFGNLADNAYEAVSKIKNAEKFISFSSSIREKWYIVNCENSFDGKVKYDENGNIITTKKDEKKHGIGLESIRKIAEKIGGKLEAKPVSGDVFRVNLVFPRENKDKK